MGYGILTGNQYGHVLISADTKNLHYLGEAQYEQQLFGGLSDFPDYSDDDGQQTLSGLYLHRLYFTTSEEPLVFLKPGNVDNFYGIVRRYRNNGVIYFDIAQSGYSAAPPRLFLFSRHSQTTPHGYGLVTYTTAGEIAFDSTKRPLAILDAMAVACPQEPCDGGVPTSGGGYGWEDRTLDFNFRCNTTYTTYNFASVVARNAVMVAVPSTMQAVKIRKKEGSKTSCDDYGTNCQDHYSTAMWWGMYHQGFRISAGNAIDAGWIVYAAGFYFWSHADDTFLGIGGDGGDQSGGSAPYPASTINSATQFAILADSSLYI